ncbi:hypothetical protein J2R87_004671 [Bradyrhizobium elkanii]|nr:hypothetical protein [Bradyrhizobium elkanii]MCP1970931.1 hypothetical protein [Bradyrhizobium elkanii]MCS4107562.1 hypothetical protein [Bradyrhizobium elkanii]ODM74708.1 hypothetical protein A6X20_34550 [Bradyrhizobium elkanii]ODM75897.1 hypothetical protein A6452_36560 [Bradyrhizobium elkanii]
MFVAGERRIIRAWKRRRVVVERAAAQPIARSGWLIFNALCKFGKGLWLGLKEQWLPDPRNNSDCHVAVFERCCVCSVPCAIAGAHGAHRRSVAIG